MESFGIVVMVSNKDKKAHGERAVIYVPCRCLERPKMKVP
jgi:hypothetical protein